MLQVFYGSNETLVAGHGEGGFIDPEGKIEWWVTGNGNGILSGKARQDAVHCSRLTALSSQAGDASVAPPLL